MLGSAVMHAEAQGLGPGRRPFTATDRVWPGAVSVRGAVMHVEALLRDHGVASDAAGLAALVLAEALNNITEHAFAAVPSDWIGIGLTLAGETLDITIEDQGAAMPGLAPPNGIIADLDVARHDLPEGGFGWFLIQQLTSDLSYVRDDGTNRLSLTIDLRTLSRNDSPV